jgi:hypothetical protein
VARADLWVLFLSNTGLFGAVSSIDAFGKVSTLSAASARGRHQLG